jgi:hypothetical protein
VSQREFLPSLTAAAERGICYWIFFFDKEVAMSVHPIAQRFDQTASATESKESSSHTGNGTVEEGGDELAQLPLVDPCSF